jgi:hypothetical protein
MTSYRLFYKKHKSHMQQGVFVYPCVCVCVCLCVYLCMYVCMRARVPCVHVFVLVCVRVETWAGDNHNLVQRMLIEHCLSY